MGRRKLRLGEWGEIRTIKLSSRKTPYAARAEFRDYDGRIRLVQRSGTSKTSARSELQKALAERARKRSTQGLNSGDTFRKAAESYLNRQEKRVRVGQLSEGTLQTYRYQMENHVLRAFSDVRLAEFDTPLVDAFLLDVFEHVGGPTAKTCRTLLNGVFGLAVRDGALAANPCREVTPLSVTSKQARALSKQDQKNWFAELAADQGAMNNDLFDLTAVLFATGLRIGEVLAIRWVDVDMTTGTLSATGTLIRVTGKGLIRKQPKSLAGNRDIEVPSWCSHILSLRRTPDVELEAPVFPTHSGGWRDPRNVHRVLKDARERMGFPDVTPHTWRKTNATVLDEAGATAREIADRLGHSRVSMTQDVYLGRRHPSARAKTALEALKPME